MSQQVDLTAVTKFLIGEITFDDARDSYYTPLDRALICLVVLVEPLCDESYSVGSVPRLPQRVAVLMEQLLQSQGGAATMAARSAGLYVPVDKRGPDDVYLPEELVTLLLQWKDMPDGGIAMMERSD